MKKRLMAFVLLSCLLTCFTLPAAAESLPTADNWSVIFSAQKQMVSNFTSANMDETIRGMQPGDDVTFKLMLRNDYNEATDWYMENKVLSSLEDSVKNASGGAYTYRLTYTNKSGTEKVLFDSDTVGGDTVTKAGEGLKQATDALEDYFYLDTLSNGQSGRITLKVALDGETQGNSYQDTLADLKMNFAVELATTAQPSKPNNPSSPDNPSNPPKTGDSTKKTDVIYTGDETNLTPFYIAGGIAGLVLLLLAVIRLRRENEEKAS